MTGKVRFGIGFPNRGILFGSTSVAEMFEFARIADGTDGFDSFWVGDSLLSKPRVESIACLGAIAALTKRVRIGPACLASFPLRDLLPKPIQNPLPIWIANNVRGDLDSDLVQNALRRVARLADGWQTAVIYPPDFGRRWKRLLELVADQGKDPEQFENSMYYNVNFNADKAAAREETLEFLRQYYLTQNYPEPAFDAWTAWGSAEEVIDRLGRYVEAGVQTFVIRFPSWEMGRQLDTFVERVLPSFESRLAPRRMPVTSWPATVV